MKNLFNAARLLLLDFASTLFFLAVYLLTHNILLAVVLGIALAFAQIGWRLIRRDPIDTMQDELLSRGRVGHCDDAHQ